MWFTNEQNAPVFWEIDNDDADDSSQYGLKECMSFILWIAYTKEKWSLLTWTQFSVLGLSGLYNGMSLYCLGVARDVMTMILTNRRDVDNMNKMLRQTQDVVQDLQEEVDMIGSFNH